MKWLIYHNITSDASPFIYFNSVKIAYLLNLKLVSIGIDEGTYFICEGSDRLPLEFKLDFLLAANTSNLKEYNTLAETKQSLKDFAKSKNKSSKQIVAANLLKKMVNENFSANLQGKYQMLADIYQLDIFKELIDDNLFYFYRNRDNTPVDSNNNFDFVNSIMQLDLPDTDKGNALFFLSNYKANGVLMPIDFLNATDKDAEDLNNFYGEESYVFPLMASLTSNELISTRKELEKTTLEFREKIDEWATICYANPNSNVGLDYFRIHLQPYLKSSTNDVLKNPFLQNVSSLTQKNLESQVIIGEAPIEKIWELYLVSKNIKQEDYDHLMQLKTEQYPKFEGRWPIVFFKRTDEANNYLKNEAQNDGVQSVRKSISID